jgi:hypothetical protein
MGTDKDRLLNGRPLRPYLAAIWDGQSPSLAHGHLWTALGNVRKRTDERDRAGLFSALVRRNLRYEINPLRHLPTA